METVTDFIFLVSKITSGGDCSHEIKRCLLLGRKAMTNLSSVFKSRDITLPTKVHLVKAMVFLVVMYGCELDQKENWVPKNWCLLTVCWRRFLRILLECKKIKLVSPKGNQPWAFIVRTDAETEAPVIWPPYVKSQLVRKDLDTGKVWRWKEKGATEDEMVGWHHWLDGCVWASSGRWERTGKPSMLLDGGAKSHTQLNDWTATTRLSHLNIFISSFASRGFIGLRPFIMFDLLCKIKF